MFRNREIRQFLVLFVILAFAAAAAGFVIHPAAGILSLVTAAAFGTAFFVFTKARYKNLSQISEQIDLVLIMRIICLSVNLRRANFLSCKARSQK